MTSRLSDLLDGALRGAGLEATSIIWRIAEAWPDIVGPRVASRAAPVRLRRGELTISAADAVWRQELTLLGPEIVARVNQKIGEDVAQRVRLVSGPLRSPETPRRRRLRPPGDPAPRPTPAGPAESPPSPAGPGVAAALEALARARSDRLAADARPARRSRRRRR